MIDLPASSFAAATEYISPRKIGRIFPIVQRMYQKQLESMSFRFQEQTFQTVQYVSLSLFVAKYHLYLSHFKKNDTNILKYGLKSLKMPKTEFEENFKIQMARSSKATFKWL